jgi:hypothetical protein
VRVDHRRGVRARRRVARGVRRVLPVRRLRVRQDLRALLERRAHRVRDRAGSSSAVHLAFGPHGSSKALYYTTYAGGGEVRRIAYTARSTARRPPPSRRRRPRDPPR